MFLMTVLYTSACCFTQASMYLNVYRQISIHRCRYTERLNKFKAFSVMVCVCVCGLSKFDELHNKIQRFQFVSNVRANFSAVQCERAVCRPCVCVCLGFSLVYWNVLRFKCMSESKCLPSSENHNKVQHNVAQRNRSTTQKQQKRRRKGKKTKQHTLQKTYNKKKRVCVVEKLVLIFIYSHYSIVSWWWTTVQFPYFSRLLRWRRRERTPLER